MTLKTALVYLYRAYLGQTLSITQLKSVFNRLLQLFVSPEIKKVSMKTELIQLPKQIQAHSREQYMYASNVTLDCVCIYLYVGCSLFFLNVYLHNCCRDYYVTCFVILTLVQGSAQSDILVQKECYTQHQTGRLGTSYKEKKKKRSAYQHDKAAPKQVNKRSESCEEWYSNRNKHFFFLNCVLNTFHILNYILQGINYLNNLSV